MFLPFRGFRVTPSTTTVSRTERRDAISCVLKANASLEHNFNISREFFVPLKPFLKVRSPLFRKSLCCRTENWNNCKGALQPFCCFQTGRGFATVKAHRSRYSRDSPTAFHVTKPLKLSTGAYEPSTFCVCFNLGVWQIFVCFVTQPHFLFLVMQLIVFISLTVLRSSLLVRH